MGKLALYGALGGLGAGMIANAEQQQKEHLMKLDEERQERLTKMQMAHQETMAATREAADATRHQQSLDAGNEGRAAEFAFRSLEGVNAREQQAEQNRLDRESEEKRTRMMADASSNRVGGKKPYLVRADIPTEVSDPKFPGVFKKSIAPGAFSRDGTRYVQDGENFAVVDKTGQPTQAYKEAMAASPKGIADVEAGLQLKLSKVKDVDALKREVKTFRRINGYVPSTAMELLAEYTGGWGSPGDDEDE